MNSLPLDQLYKLWDSFANIPVNIDTELEEPFMHFDKGDSCFDVWNWFESQNDGFVVGDVMQGIRN